MTLTVVALTAAGCAAGSSTRAPRATVALSTGPIRHFSPGLWRFYRTAGRQPEVANVIDRAEQVDLKRRMKQAGFAYFPITPEPVGGILLDGLATTPGDRPPSETTMLDIERAHGFGIAARVRAEHAKPPQQNSRYVASLKPAVRRRYFHALYGDRKVTIVRFPDGSIDTVPTSGCFAAASDALFGSVSHDDFRLNAVLDVRQLVERDVSQMKEATARWSRCLAHKSSRRFATQNALVAWLMTRYTTLPFTTAHQLEIHYATLSTTSMYRTGAEARYAATTWNVLRHMPAAWYRAVVDVRRWDSAALSSANTVLRRTSHLQAG